MSPQLHTHAPSRRQFLRAGSSLLALPWLESLAGAAPAASPRRMVMICNTFSFYGPSFFPAEAGENYTPSEYLAILGDLRKKFTVFSGISHPDIGGDHASESCFLTSAKRPTAPGFRNSMSLDFLAARHMGGKTRFPLLSLSSIEGGGLTYTSTGAGVPAMSKPSDVFKKMFLAGSPQEMKAEIERLKRGRSVLDRMQERFGDLGRELSARDRQQIDDYSEAVRELEKQIASDEEWAGRPKPAIDEKPPADAADRGDVVGRSRLMFKIVRLALQTDSTRVISLAIRGQDIRPPIEGVTEDHHNVSHHGNDPKKIEQLKLIEREEMKAFKDFLADLDGTPDGDGSLLDATQVLVGSNLGSAAWHDTHNLPILLAGGGWKHGRHVAGDTKNNTPLGKLFVSMLRRFGVEADSFGSGHGPVEGLV